MFLSLSLVFTLHVTCLDDVHVVRQSSAIAHFNQQQVPLLVDETYVGLGPQFVMHSEVNITTQYL